MIKAWVAVAASLALATLPLSHARAEQPIRVVNPYAPGGVGDASMRLIAEHMRVALNRPVIVENKAGAGGRIGVQAVKDANPDGSVLLFTPIAPMAVFEHVYDKLFAGDLVPRLGSGRFDLRHPARRVPDPAGPADL